MLLFGDTPGDTARCIACRGIAGAVPGGRVPGTRPDDAACRIIRARARYTPARDSAGNPTAGNTSGRVTWRIAEE